MNDHIVFFDDQCPFCYRTVKRLYEIDEKKRFLFASFRGMAAREILMGPQEKLKGANSLVFVEHYRSTNRKFWARSHALLRIYRQAGNRWGAPGILSFLTPQWIGDPLYDWFARHRHQFKLDILEAPVPKDRFLS